MSDHKKIFTTIEIIEDKTEGLVKLDLVERFGQDRKSKLRNNFVGHLSKSDPQFLQQIFELLNNYLPEPTPNETVIGLVTSGIVMASMLALVRKTKYNYSVDAKFKGYEGVCSFCESHRDDKKHYFYGLNPGDEVVFVEDEVTTGNGVIMAVNALRDYGIKVNAICSVIEVVNFDASSKIKRETGLDLITLMKVQLV